MIFFFVQLLVHALLCTATSVALRFHIGYTYAGVCYTIRMLLYAVLTLADGIRMLTYAQQPVWRMPYVCWRMLCLRWRMRYVCYTYADVCPATSLAIRYHIGWVWLWVWMRVCVREGEFVRACLCVSV
jgi:hypothetical protein